ncbi:pyruvate formate lyase family protein [Catenisphaera adipataccumulans]|uniref:Pyruvate-formate lyase n=1 Tax=Catenisphaera adipataccumulans TaxID=700500 RepID=A0A7W8CYM6_9FIRM|nr:pyruvate formate lyase family protein [Catenisphaera adipataccumulans]MBB5182823.1 pyruvate-formate lyase [Catenisphaera adipataccumulans]
MVKFDVEGSQNVNVSKIIPCEKTDLEQLEIMERYTQTHRKYSSASRARREVECQKVLFPTLYRSIEKQDLIVGRMDFLPIGFGSVTSVGGVGHYCRFDQLHALGDRLGEAYKPRIEKLYNYWLDHDVKTIYCRENLTDVTIGRFIDPSYPLLATARLSGMMLDYPKLLDNGIGGLKKLIASKKEKHPESADFYDCCMDEMDLLTECALYLADEAVRTAQGETDEKRKAQLMNMAAVLRKISVARPETFPEALQLLWLYALPAGVINYGRLDDFLGPYLARDLDEGRMSEQDAYDYIKSLWTMIENRRTTVNGRVIVGGKGRKHPAEADRFMHIALKVCKDCRYVEPQFTLRIDENTDEQTWAEVMDALGAGATYPTLYNDEVNVPAVAWGMRVDPETATRYVPFGCTEFVLWGQSTGTPNTLINLLKILNIYMNNGVDPMDGKYKLGPIQPKDMAKIKSFDEFYDGYKELLNYYMDLSVQAQYNSYGVMNRECSFLLNSILMDDCLERGKALLDGGVRYLGGTCETYGNINASDSLYAIKHLVFEEKKYTLPQLEEAVLHNFVGYAEIRHDCLACDKYGNDLDTADQMANSLYEFVAKGIRDRGIQIGMQYYEIVISNNSLNTEWGLQTAASPDGRLSGMYMNPANNPQGGADKGSPTQLLNSLSTFDARYHAGSVQNIKFSKPMFNQNKKLIEQMFKVYFRKGGCHVMVTVVDKGALEDAMVHPEKYPDLIVRVAGYSAVFVNLDRTVQEELLSRTLYDESRL